MKTLLPKIVNRTPKFLTDVKFHLFVAYCLKNSFSNSDAQKLVTNQKLYSWFNKQVSMLEDEFLYAVSNGKILNQSPMELYGLYYFRISKVKQLTPMRILNGIRKVNSKTVLEYYNTCLN